MAVVLQKPLDFTRRHLPLHAGPPLGQGLSGDGQRHLSGLPRRQRNLLEVTQGADAGGRHALQPVKVQLWNRAGGPRAGVCNRDGEGQAVYFFGLCVLGRLQKPVGKRGIRQAAAKGIPGPVLGVVIGQAAVRDRVIVLDRQQSGMIRQGYR